MNTFAFYADVFIIPISVRVYESMPFFTFPFIRTTREPLIRSATNRIYGEKERERKKK